MAKMIKCPVCKGKNPDCIACKGGGKIVAPKKPSFKKDITGEIATAANRLRKRGYVLREIAKILGYRNPQSIAHLLKKSKKLKQP